MSEFIYASIDRFENDMAIIKTDDGQQLNWPIDKLPDGTKEGEVVKLILQPDQTQEVDREMQAKDLLNEILKNDD